MTTDLEFKKLLYKVAKAYYEDELTQEQIAQRFGLSRIKVSRLLCRARQERIVQINIVPPQATNADLERAIEACYHLDEAVVITPDTPNRLVSELGVGAAECLVRSLQGNEILTLSWGTTLRAVIEALPPQNWPEMCIVQMLGGVGRPEAEVYGADLVHRMALTFTAKARMLSAPGIVISPQVRDALLSDPQIANTLALAARAQVALVGLGTPRPGAMVVKSGILSPQKLDELNQLGAVGDIALRFFDAEGNPVQHEIDNRIIGLTLEEIRRIPRVIGVAGGPDKYEAIRAALCGGLLNVLVTDEQTARRLIQEV